MCICQHSTPAKDGLAVDLSLLIGLDSQKLMICNPRVTQDFSDKSQTFPGRYLDFLVSPCFPIFSRCLFLPSQAVHELSVSYGPADAWKDQQPKSQAELWKDPPFSMGKLTISMAIFNSFLYVYQRVTVKQCGFICFLMRCWLSKLFRYNW